MLAAAQHPGRGTELTGMIGRETDWEGRERTRWEQVVQTVESNSPELFRTVNTSRLLVPLFFPTNGNLLHVVFPRCSHSHLDQETLTDTSVDKGPFFMISCRPETKTLTKNTDIKEQ